MSKVISCLMGYTTGVQHRKSCGQNQALVYLQAHQLMHLGRFPEALQAVSGFLGGDNCGVLASRWAVHMTVHIHWLMGNLAQVRSAFCLGAAMTE